MFNFEANELLAKITTLKKSPRNAQSKKLKSIQQKLNKYQDNFIPKIDDLNHQIKNLQDITRNVLTAEKQEQELAISQLTQYQQNVKSYLQSSKRSYHQAHQKIQSFVCNVRSKMRQNYQATRLGETQNLEQLLQINDNVEKLIYRVQSKKSNIQGDYERIKMILRSKVEPILQKNNLNQYNRNQKVDSFMNQIHTLQLKVEFQLQKLSDRIESRNLAINTNLHELLYFVADN